MSNYSPGETAEKSGFSIDTLRYYEKIGLLSDVARDTAGRRVFTDDDLAWLHMLRCLRGTGMPIAEMLRYSELARGGEGTLQERLRLLQDHDRRVEEQIAKLREQQAQIQWKIAFYGSQMGADCSGAAVAHAAAGDEAAVIGDPAGDAAAVSAGRG